MNDKLIAELACKVNMTVFPSGLEKFVELIVKECAKIADDNFNKGFCPVGDYIKQHFGVNDERAYHRTFYGSRNLCTKYM